MAYKKFIFNGREMLNLDNRGMVEYDEYYSISGNSTKRRSKISDIFLSIQKNDIIKNEPSMNYSVQYQEFLDKLKKVNPDMYNQKSKMFKEYIDSLRKEELQFEEEKNQLLSNGYQFDSRLKKYGYYVFKAEDKYFQYTEVKQKDAKIDMENNLLSQRASISNYEILPLTNEDLLEIKMDISRRQKNQKDIERKRIQRFAERRNQRIGER